MNSENVEAEPARWSTAGECKEPNPHGGVVCRRPRGHAGGHVDTNGVYWQRHDSVLDAALTPPGYSLPAGELTMCDAKAPAFSEGGDWTCTLLAGHEGRHEAHGASPLPVWDDGCAPEFEGGECPQCGSGVPCEPGLVPGPTGQPVTCGNEYHDDADTSAKADAR